MGVSLERDDTRQLGQVLIYPEYRAESYISGDHKRCHGQEAWQLYRLCISRKSFTLGSNQA